jgi:tetratricopeptide (TPR) repeat protein
MPWQLTARGLKYLAGTLSIMISISRPVLSLPLLCAAAISVSTISAQQKIEFPQASQHSVIKQRIGLTDVEIDYSRPNKNDREIFGGLLPWGKVWRTGANASTKIKFSDAIKIGDSAEVPAGEYALYTIPTENEWTIILSKDTKGWGAYEYKTDTDAARVTVKPATLSSPLETFTINFSDLKDDSANLTLDWDTTHVSVPLTTNTVAKLDAQIDAALKTPDSLDARFYYNAASFYYAHDRNPEQALKWIDLAIQKDPKLYSFYYKKAQIEAKLGHKAESIAAAEKSIELLKGAKTQDESAIRNSQMLIDAQH